MKFEKEIKKLIDRVELLEKGYSKPYECPTCNGMCTFKVFGEDKRAKCPSCKGKGIVWWKKYE